MAESKTTEDDRSMTIDDTKSTAHEIQNGQSKINDNDFQMLR